MRGGLIYLLVGTAVLSGCSSIPERELENAFRYLRLKRNEIHEIKPIPSEYQELASKAWKNREQGGTAEYVSILELGDDALLARIHLIRAAEESIDIQTYIWKDDPCSRFVFDELVKAAERGVLVRILCDAMNMPGDPYQMARMAQAHRNLEIAVYKPLADVSEVGKIGLWKGLLFKTKRMNRRMHNKLMLVDGRIGIAGGRNYEDRYYDRNIDFLFRDRDVLVAGPAVIDMVESFDRFWQDQEAVFITQLEDVQVAFNQLNGGYKPFLNPENKWMFAEIDEQANARSLSNVRKSLQVYEADSVQFIYDTPAKFSGDQEGNQFDEWFEHLIEESQERLVYQTPYLIYSRDVRRELKRKRKKYPNYRVIASSNGLASADHVHVYALSFKHRKELYKKTGIDIYESKPFPGDQAEYVYNLSGLVDQAIRNAGITNRADIAEIDRAGPTLCIHAKSFVIDGKVALIGSHNFDPRSAKLNTECGVFIQDEEVAAELERLILNACEPQNAWTVSKGPKTPGISHFSGVVGGISTALPVFDIWPYRYTTNYELKDGYEPLEPRNLNFQQNYVDVGYFPEVPDSSTVIQARLMKGFLGWARPFM
ncbi:phospholipase D family protein [Pontiellaceae bacterium B1224]|nr:phospholipase D family protein [Pontiellaceae bacterium B1224]